MRSHFIVRVIGWFALPGLLAAQVRVAGSHEIDANDPTIGAALAAGDRFGSALASPGDLDGDGRDELVVGSSRNDLGGANAGVVYVLFLGFDGSVQNADLIGEHSGGFNVLLDPGDNFGEGVTAIGDLDGDGREELIVSAPGDDDGGPDQGALWVLFPNANGSIHAWQKISRTTGGFTGALCCGQVRFGKAVARIGDLDADGRDEVAVSTDTEQLFILFLNANGTVSSNPSLARPPGSTSQDGLGGSLAGPGDIDLDGVPDLLVGAQRLSRKSAVYTIFLAANGTALSTTRVSWSAGGFAGVTAETAPLASSLAPLGDIDLDGELDFAMGTTLSSGYCSPYPDFFFCTEKTGSAWIAGLHSNGTLGVERRIGAGSGGIGPLAPVDGFGGAVTPVGDLDGNGTVDLAIGASFDDGTATDQGSVWIAFLEPGMNGPGPKRVTDPPAPRSRTATPVPHQLGNHARGFTDTLHAYSMAGTSVAVLGDLDNDGNPELALGAPGADAGNSVDAGAFRILFLDAHGKARSQVEIPASQFGLSFGSSWFAWSLGALGDLNGDGVEDLAVGCPELNRAWVVFLNADGSVSSSVRISDALPDPYFGTLANTYGSGLAGIGDIDGDGVGDLALMDAGGFEGENGNTFYVVFLNANGSVKGFVGHPFGSGLGYTTPVSCASVGDLDGDGRNEVAIGDSSPRQVRIHFLNANGSIRSSSLIGGPIHTRFGAAVAGVGDLDGDGVADLAVGAPTTNDFRGAYWIVHLLPSGGQKSSVQFQGPGGLAGLVAQGDQLGWSLAFLGDPDGDLRPSLVVGARGTDDLNTDSGSAWIVDLP